MERERVCKSCGRTHIEIADITKEEVDSFMYLDNRVSTARTWIEKKDTQPQVIAAAMQLESDTFVLVKQWWIEMSKKYGFETTMDIMVDFDNNTLYYMK